MAGSSPSEAVEIYIGRLTKAVNCVSDARVQADLWTAPSTSQPYGTTSLIGGDRQANNLAISLSPSDDDSQTLYLYIQQNYRPVEVADDPVRGPWRIQTMGYRYKITDGEHLELFLWHWEPMSRSPRKRPHMHVKAARAIENTPISSLHIPTGRVLLEDIIRFVIEEMEIQHIRPDWDQHLTENVSAFEKDKTWDREPPMIAVATIR